MIPLPDEGLSPAAAVESLLFASGEPIAAKRIAEITGIPLKEIKAALTELQRFYNSPGRGIELVEIAGGYLFLTRALYVSLVEKLYRPRRPTLSAAALETLAVIAYRQPITRGEIEEIRGVSVDGVVSALLERHLIREVGRRDAPGRPVLLGTTEEFLNHFGLLDLSELPPLDSLAVE